MVSFRQEKQEESERSERHCEREMRRAGTWGKTEVKQSAHSKLCFDDMSCFLLCTWFWGFFLNIWTIRKSFSHLTGGGCTKEIGEKDI